MKIRFRKWFKKLWPYALGVVVSGLIVLAAWIVHLDRIVTQQFEGRRWTLPALVYAQPLELYVGQSLSGAEFETELKRLGYQQVDKPEHPGSFRRNGDRFDLISRKFRFWDEDREAQALSVLAGQDRIEGMFDSKGVEVPVHRLDPLLIGSIFPIHGEDRIIVKPDEVPQLLPAALKIVEDRRFDSHHGVDPMGILRAMWVNLRSGSFSQGGSTLTQQLVRSYFLNNRQTLSRKITEAMMSILLEAHFDKIDVMNAYINEINLGQDGNRAVHGFGLASQFYFGKPLRELQLHEIALLVTEVRSASYYNPRRHPQRAKTRRNLILDLLAEHGAVSAEEAKEAKAKPLGLVNSGGTGGSYYPSFLDFVRRTLRRDYQDEDLTEQGLTIFTTLNPHVQSKAENALVTELTRLDKTRKRKDATLEGAVVVTVPQSGEVAAIVGGRQVGFSGFNRALDAKRSFGSTAKPIVYLAAIETGRFNAASVVNDMPVTIKLANGQTWTPKNDEKDFNGPVPLVRALTKSLNLATVDLGMQVGLPNIIEEFNKLGLERNPPEVPAIVLGGFDVTPMEAAQVFNTLANSGFRTPLRAVRAVVDADGKPLKAFPLEVTQVADPAAVYQIDRMMVEVMRRGTASAARAKLGDLVVAGKTGTSSGNRDSWFAGFSGSTLAVVWVGYDDNQQTGLYGVSGALPVWTQLMANIENSSWDQPLPDELVETLIDFPTGLGATAGCTDNVMMVAIPRGAYVPMHEGCGKNNPIERAGAWLRGVISK